MMQFTLDGVDVTIKFGYEAAVTMCYMTLDGNYVGGYALCSSNDVFNKETGRKIALRRALEMAGVDKPHRTAIWLKYHSRNEVPDTVAFVLAFVPEAEYLPNFEVAYDLAVERSKQSAYQLEFDFGGQHG